MTQISSRDFKIYDLHELRNLPCSILKNSRNIFFPRSEKKNFTETTNLPSSLYQGSSKGNQKITPSTFTCPISKSINPDAHARPSPYPISFPKIFQYHSIEVRVATFTQPHAHSTRAHVIEARGARQLI